PPHSGDHAEADVVMQAQISQGEGYGEAIDGDGSARAPWPPADKPEALTGELAAIEHALRVLDIDGALVKARDWHAKEPGDVRALIGLGDALEAKGSYPTAARVYGSIIDLFPGRADMRRFAGERLERVGARGESIELRSARSKDRNDLA